MKKRIILFLCFFAFWGIMAGCAQKQAVSKQESSESGQSYQNFSIKEQEKQAYDIFRQILVLSDSPDRKKNLPEIKSLYRKIIDRYPDLALAQESYMRLVILAREENSPEGDAEARSVYREFLHKYPESRLQRIIENELNKKQ